MKIYKFWDGWSIDLATWKSSLTKAMKIHFVLFLVSWVPFRPAFQLLLPAPPESRRANEQRSSDLSSASSGSRSLR